jgi:hypothetical protein
LNGDGCTLTGPAVNETIINVHCSLWAALAPGESYYVSYATNEGQWAVDGTFQVAIAGTSTCSSSLIADIDVCNRILCL